MGPRSADRGIVVLSVPGTLGMQSLQWGRDQLIAELKRLRAIHPQGLESFNGAAIS